MTYTLLASAPSQDALLASIEKFYCGTKMRIIDGNVQRLSDGKILDTVRVIQKGKRFRFEMVQP